MTETGPHDARVLIVDDQEPNVKLLEAMLRHAGYVNLKSTTDSRQVLALYAQWQPDLILLDLVMPYLDGTAVMKQLEPHIREGDYLPILVITADITPEAKRRALAGGAKDFLTKPFDPVEVLLRINNLAQTRSLHLQLENQNKRLEDKVRERTSELEQKLRELTALNSVFQKHLVERFTVAEAYREILAGLERLLRETTALTEQAKSQSLPDLRDVAPRLV